MDVLQDLAERYSTQRAGARAAAIVANSVARSFFRPVKNRLKREHKADPERSLRISEDALALFAQSSDPAMNLPQRQLVEQRYACWTDMHEEERGNQEVASLVAGLANRGVNASVLAGIKSSMKTPRQDTAREEQRASTKKSTSRKKASRKSKRPK